METNHEPKNAEGVRCSEMGRPRGVVVEITYHRICPSDATGMVDVCSEGAENWVYADTGSHHGAQCEHEGQGRRVVEFGAKLAALVREYFGAVPPLLDEDVGRRGRRRAARSTVGTQRTDTAEGAS